jgi:elongation factor 3
MAPAAVDTMETVSPATVKSENQKSMKVLEELLSKLSVSKAQDEINATSLDLASFINGDIVEEDAPTK